MMNLKKNLDEIKQSKKMTPVNGYLNTRLFHCNRKSDMLEFLGHIDII